MAAITTRSTAGTGATVKNAPLTNTELDTNFINLNTELATKGPGTVTSVSGTGTVSGLTLSGTVTSTGNLTLGGTLSVAASNFASQTANTILAAPNGTAGTPSFRALVAADIPTLNQNTTGTASNVTGTVAVANGGTGQTTIQAAINSLAGAVTSGQYLRGNGTNVVMSAIQAADIPTLNQNTTGNAATATALQTARSINAISFNGTANILIPTIYDSNYRRITQPGGAEYVTSTATVTGAIAVTLPVGMTDSMLRMTIKVYEYTTNESFEINVGGYAYNVGNTWANNPFAYIIGNPSIDRRFTVRLGYNSTSAKAVIYIGELASTWSYPQVFVTDIQVGYSGTQVGYTTGWSIGFEASAFQNVTATISNCQVGYATSTNTANATVLRDASGNFSAGTITASLSGNATTATTANALNTANSYTVASINTNWIYHNDVQRDAGSATYYPNAQFAAASFRFVNAGSVGTGGNYAGLLHFAPWDGTTASTGDASYQLAFGSTATNGGGNPQLRLRKGIDTTWNAWVDILSSANYSSYAPTLTGTGASGTWGINITGSAGSLSSNGNYLVSRGSVDNTALDTAINNGFYTVGYTGFSRSLLVWDAGGSTGATQIESAYGATGDLLRFRNRTDSSTWTAWKQIIHSGNYNSYSPTLTGGGASGTWGINITGNAATATSATNASNATTAGGLSVHSGRNNEANKIVRTDANGYIQAGYINSSSGNENNASSPPRVWGTNGSDDYLRTYQTSSLSVGYATTAGSAPANGGTASAVTINYNNDSNSTYQMLWGSGNSVYGTGGIYCNPFTDYVYAASFNASNWFRSSGVSGWYNETYGGGIYMEDTTYVRVYNGKSFYCPADILAAGNVTAYSDIRLKTDLQQIPDAVAKVEQLTGYTYTRTDSGERQTGLIAQDVEKVLPEAVMQGEHLSLAYGNMVGLLVEAVKELSARVKELEAR